MNLFKSKKNLLLLVSSVIVWLGTCLLAMHWNTVYDGAIGGFPTYLWGFAPVALIFNIFMNSRPSNPDGRDHSRWAQALLVFLVALMLFIALLSGMNPLYEISFWWIAALIVLSFIGLLIGKCMNHPLQEASLRQSAYTILLLYLSSTFVGAAVISEVEGLPLGACLYETASAAGTVGLTLGLTPQLGTLSQSILILLMFFGRVGGLTLIYAAFSGHDLTYARYPKEMITVG